MKVLIITLPLPPRTLNENVHVAHWSMRARAVKSYKTAAYYATMDAINRNPEFRQALPLDRVELIPAIFFRSPNRRDSDNWNPALKAARDGIAKAGVVVNDETVTTMPPELKIDKNNPRVELVIQETLPPDKESDDA